MLNLAEFEGVLNRELSQRKHLLSDKLNTVQLFYDILYMIQVQTSVICIEWSCLVYGLSNFASVTSEISQYIVFTGNSYQSIVSGIEVAGQA